MTDITLNEGLWACSMLPEGIVETWLVADGDAVAECQPLVSVRIEDSIHEVTAPVSGRVEIFTPVNSVIEPGSVLGVVLR